MIDSVLLHTDLAFTRTDFNIGLWLLFCCRVGLYSGSEIKSRFISRLEIELWVVSILYDFKDLFQFQIHQLMVYRVLLSNQDDNFSQ